MESGGMKHLKRIRPLSPIRASLIPGRRGDEVHVSRLLYQGSPATLIDLLVSFENAVTRTRLEPRGETTK